MIPRRIKFVFATTGMVLFFAFSAAHAAGAVGAAYTMTNAATGNEILAFDRFGDGSLQFSAAYPTGGLGTGDGLGNQGGIVLSANGNWLVVVNAGSGELSVFRVHADGLTLTDTASSGGVRPVSVAIHQDLVYVVNAGGTVGDVDSIAGLRLGSDGTLSPLPASTQPLSAPFTAPAQIKFSPDGQFVLVTEKATSLIGVFPVDPEGYTGPPVWNPAFGQTPFAMDFGKRSQLFVSEVFGGGEDAGAVSSYYLRSNGMLEVIDGSVPNTETAPCWLVVTQGGGYVLTTNTPDDSLSAYAVDFGGRLELLDEDGRSGEPGAGTRPLDMDLSGDGRFLFTLNIGDGTISTFAILPGGSLDHLHVVEGIPAGVNGLVVR